MVIAICCLSPIILIIGTLSLYKGDGNYWLWLIILICPLSHIFMMGEHGRGGACEKESEKELYRKLVRAEKKKPLEIKIERNKELHN